MISVTPSPPQPSRTAWTSKPCPPCRGTTMPGSPCAPTPTPRSRSRTRPPRLWAASWDRLYNRVSSSKNRTGRQIFPSGCALPTELQQRMATRKGLEPSTSGVTGRRSNQLNYRAIFLSKDSGRCNLSWQGQKDSNPRHSVLETDALPAELYP